MGTVSPGALATHLLALLCESLSLVSSLATIGVFGFSILSSDLVLSSKLSMTPANGTEAVSPGALNKASGGYSPLVGAAWAGSRLLSLSDDGSSWVVVVSAAVVPVVVTPLVPLLVL